jgi:two-component system, chemotaxis family, protein-glutamate methylesterase/glutaminase
MSEPFLVAIGASAGGVSTLLDLAALLPANFPAVVGIVLHVGMQPSMLPELMTRRGPNRAVHPCDGELPQPGTLYVAPPDRHMLVGTKTIQLNHGPRENHARPAIDPLFRAAALEWRSRAIGVVLTGAMDDGTAGLAAIKECGGMTIVQDPATAIDPSMPASALANVDVDHCLPVDGIAALLRQLVVQPRPDPVRPAPELLRREQAAFEGVKVMDNLSALGSPSVLTCPDCGGTLFELKDTRPLRYRCHTGHAYTARTLESAQAHQTDEGLWSTFRSLREREMLLRRVASVVEATGDSAQAQAGRREAERLREQAESISQLMAKDTSGA